MREQGITLSPETIDTMELVWEEYIGPHLRTTASVFRYDASHLIAQREPRRHQWREPVFHERGPYDGARRGRRDRGALERTHGSRQLRERRRDGLDLAGAAVELTAASGQGLDSFFRSNPSATSAGTGRAVHGRTAQPLTTERFPGSFSQTSRRRRHLGKALDLQFGLYNALNRRVHADPGSEEHLQRAIVQDGRTLRVRLMAKF